MLKLFVHLPDIRIEISFYICISYMTTFLGNIKSDCENSMTKSDQDFLEIYAQTNKLFKKYYVRSVFVTRGKF